MILPIEPPPSLWTLGRPTLTHPSDLWAIGADLEPGTLLAAYRIGLFPMRLPDGPIGWWWPHERGVIPLEPTMPRTVRRAARRFEIRVDTAFGEVVQGCADPARPHSWIDDEVIEAYQELHRLGWAHSIEAWDAEGLAGGLYGVELGGLFAAESKFHRRTDASKAAVAGLVELLRDAGHAQSRLLDVQWVTPHLERLGAVRISRGAYRVALAEALLLPGAVRPATPRLGEGR